MFKVGDKVRIIKNHCSLEYRCEEECPFFNRIGTVYQIRDKYFFVVKFQGTEKYCSGFTGEMLELYKKVIKVYGIVKFLKTYEK